MKETAGAILMLWSLVKTWAKSHGYETLKDKGNEDNGDPIQYYWSKIDNPQASGVAKSVSKLATAIYNDITNDEWIEHQTEYKLKKETKFTVSDYGS